MYKEYTMYTWNIYFFQTYFEERSSRLAKWDMSRDVGVRDYPKAQRRGHIGTKAKKSPKRCQNQEKALFSRQRGDQNANP